MKRKVLIVALTFVAVALTNCDRREQPRSDLRGGGTVSATGAIRLGLLPEQNIFRQMGRYEPIAKYLSQKLGVDVELKILPRYGNVINNFRSDKLDGAFFGSFTYALAHEELGVRVLARPEGTDGKSSYCGLIFVRKDSGIRTLGDMRGKRFVFVDKATTAGYVFPLFYFRRHGIDYRSYLRDFYFAGTHETAIYDVLERKADIGAAKDTIFMKLAAEDPRINEELQILERSAYVPENGLAVRQDLDLAVTEKLRSALLEMDRDAEGAALLRAFGARRFIETTEEDYRPVYEYARKAGIDLATYDYLND